MALNLRRLTDVYNLKVYMEDGMYLGDVEDAVLTDNRIYGWKIKVNDPELVKRGIKGLIVQHQLVKAIGQIMIVSKVPVKGEDTSEEEKPMEES